MDKIAKFTGYIVIFFVAIGIYANWMDDSSAPRRRQKQFLRQETYVASDDAAIVKFTVKASTQVRMVLTIKNQVPLDVVTTRGSINKTQYFVALGAKTFSDFVSLFSEDAAGRTQDFFGNAMSQRGTYQEFSTPWVNVEPGVYSIIIDNTDAFTPTRGDAIINIKLFERV